MRLATKSTLAALIAFLILLGGFSWWTTYQLQSFAATLMEGTARLLGSEIAAVISESAVEELLRADATARVQLERTVADLATHSDVVASVSVVDADGQVVASNELEGGRQLPLPDVIFHDDKSIRFMTYESALNGGKYHLFVPLLRGDAVVGYLRLSIGSTRIVQLYRRARHQLFLLGAGGLAFVAALGFLLQVRLSRVAAALTRVLQGDVRADGVVPPRDDSGEFAQAIAAARKVGQELSTARAQSADARRRFGSLMKVMDVGVLLVSADLTLDVANDSARTLLGCMSEEQLVECWNRIRPSLLQSVGALPAEGGRVDLDVPGNGRPYRIRCEFYPRDDGEGWLVLVKSREMLEALENELRLAIQMRGFAQFYMAFAHDLKAPLNAMVLNLQLLKNTLSPQNDSNDDETRGRQTRYIQTVADEVSRLDRYLRTVLTHAAPPSEVRKGFDLRELIEELGTLLEPQAKRQRVQLTIVVPEQPIHFTGHRDRLKQALLNIAINGLESMPQGGRMAIQIAEHNSAASIAIRDSGPGIPPELRGEIYKMHFTTKDGGTGIGLYVARSVVQSHGGEIRVESEPGKGTCFHVDLPLSA